MAVGFKGFGRPTVELSDEALDEAMKRYSGSNLYVVWNGLPYNWRNASLRSNVLRMIRADEKGIPVPIETLLRRAARVTATAGYDIKSARAGVFLHRGSKPSCYFAVAKDAAGAFVSAADYIDALIDGERRPLKKGAVVIAADAPAAKPVAEAEKTVRRVTRRPAATPVALEAAGDKPKTALRKRVTK